MIIGSTFEAAARRREAIRTAWGDVVANVSGEAPLTVEGQTAGFSIPAGLAPVMRLDLRATAQRVAASAGGETATVQLMCNGLVLNALGGPPQAGAILTGDAVVHVRPLPNFGAVLNWGLTEATTQGPLVFSLRIFGGNPQTAAIRFLSLSAVGWPPAY